ncbi:predicted protein [Nematostella vectensis]|uniref:Lysosomal dipeptide transporter MFSD1 n=1 Tax=Nematostella vectensis TaxID=45351 RepID=A7S520_NEMVE|nr:predicted protein [Nematostella vectensis]|eukprot:XP_001633191.1 predicted protein [Nematostella vectensis]
MFCLFLAPFRFVLLIFTCLMTFGSYYCYDMPSKIDGNPPPDGTVINGTDCIKGLGLTQIEFNLLYSIYAWTNAVIVLLAGILIDKLGNGVGALLFSSMCLIGVSTFASGLYLQGTKAMFPIMLLGRILFGSGNGSLTIVQNRICAIWFTGKELAFAFGVSLAFSRLGSVMNFFLTEEFEEKYGLQITLWGGSILCGFGVLCAITATTLDYTGIKLLNRKAEMEAQSKRMRVTDIKFFGSSYWLLAMTLMFFYNGVFPFVSDASDFIETNYAETFKFGPKTSAYIAGAVYDVSMVLGPFMGAIVDQFGKRGYLSLICALSCIPVFGLLSFAPSVHPIISTLWLGLNYSIAAASLWPSVPLIVNQGCVGTAMGLMTTIQMIGIGICNLIVGKILDMKSEHRWKYMMIFMLGNTLACVVFAVLLNINDFRKVRW